MSLIILNGRAYEVDALIFDKDGLLFQTKPFWRALALARLAGLADHLEAQDLADWLKLMGADGRLNENGRWVIEEVDVNGMLAVASPDEETVATASFLAFRLGWSWVQALNAAREVYEAGDVNFSLKEALTPQKGFPGIFNRLREHGISYGLATSDTRERALASLEMFDRADGPLFIITPKEVRRGKPDPEMLVKAAEMLNTQPSRLAMVGDSVVDVQMARAAGALGIGIPEHDQVRLAMAPYAPEIVSSLDDIVIAT